MPQVETQAARRRWWRVAFFVAVGVGLAAESIPRPGFWGSYVFDIVGPAWAYIYCRGLYGSPNSRPTWRRCTPEVAAALVLGFCFPLETGQYLGLYHGYFDPYDLLAFVAGVLLPYVADRWLESYGESPLPALGLDPCGDGCEDSRSA